MFLVTSTYPPSVSVEEKTGILQPRIEWEDSNVFAAMKIPSTQQPHKLMHEWFNARNGVIALRHLKKPVSCVCCMLYYTLPQSYLLGE